MTTPPDPTEDPVTEPPEPGPPADPAAQPETDWKAEAQKWEKRSRANKAKADQLDALTESSKTAEQKAADASERAERLAEQYVRAKLEGALTGIVPDPAAVVDDLNHKRYVTADGEVDLDKVAALRDRYASLAPAGSRAPRPNPAQGGSAPPKSLGEIIADLERKPGKSQAELRELMKLKARQMKKQG